MSAELESTAGEIVLPCPPLEETVEFFTERLGFRLDTIFPAERPRVAIVCAPGLRLRLERDAGGDPGTLRLPREAVSGATEEELVAPNGTRVHLVAGSAELDVPALRPALVVARAGDSNWTNGRAGMRYRDLLPDRQGGRFVASYIRIDAAGPVPDYVHFHEVRFQVIYCYRGWVRVVYEGQGEPFVLAAGDCVLQPPRIRHRVLECSAGLEVIELGCPAEHATRLDHALELPTATLEPDRLFGGQRFVRHEAARAEWTPDGPGFEVRDTGIAAATAGLAGVRVVRSGPAASMRDLTHEGELAFAFVLAGAGELECGAERHGLAAGDGCCVPPGTAATLAGGQRGLEWLEVRLPAISATK